jgi:hypothetical protein
VALWCTAELETGLGVAGAGDTDEAAWAPWVTERDGMRVAFVCFTQQVQMAAGRNATHAAVAQSLGGARAIAAAAARRGLARDPVEADRCGEGAPGQLWLHTCARGRARGRAAAPRVGRGARA